MKDPRIKPAQEVDKKEDMISEKHDKLTKLL